ncbi:MAG TPA: MarC family protein [Dehalococcoidia bacterium]|nr:MarC family protein [Dehalococcoidia bacterium]
MDDLARAFVSFFAIIDPVGNVLVFHLFTRTLSQRDRLLTAAVAVGAAFVMLTAFSLGGHEGLDLLGISQDGFKVAAGLLLLPSAYRLVMEGQPAEGDGTPSHPLDLALVPLATPLIAGPGALAATISFSDTLGQDVTVGAFSLVLALSFAAFAAAGALFQLLGAPFLRLLARLVGIVLFAIAVDFVLDGARAFFEGGALTGT